MPTFIYFTFQNNVCGAYGGSRAYKRNEEHSRLLFLLNYCTHTIYTHTHIHTHTRTRTNTHAHTHTHTHTHTHAKSMQHIFKQASSISIRDH